MPGKAANFASQLTDLLDARAPKEVDAEDGMPQLDVADDWEHDLKEGLEHTKAKSKPLRMRGNLSQAFTTGAYKGRVVASDNAFTGEPEVEEELEDEGEEEDSAEGGEEGEESEEYSMDMDEEVEDGDEESEESEAAPAAKATKATKATKTSKADASESRAGLEHLKQVTIKARRRLQAEREAAEEGYDYPVHDVEGSVLDSDTDDLVMDTAGKVREEAISAKMDDIFAGLEDDSEEENAGDNYETFLKEEQSKKKKKKNVKAMKRKREDFEDIDEDSNQADSERGEDDDILRQINDIRASAEKSEKSLLKTEHDDEGKSEAARNQYAIWGKLVACRVHLQKTITLGSRMPSCYAYPDYIKNGSAERKSVSAISTSIVSLLDDMHALREEMLRMNPNFKSKGAAAMPAKPAVKKGKQEEVDVDRCWRACVASHSMVKDKIDQSLDYWYGRAQMQSSTGGAQLKQDTPATKQIQQTLKRENLRLMRKNQKNRAGRLPFGHPNTQDVKKDPRILHTDEFIYNEDIYDDTDFYKWLLTDYSNNSADSRVVTNEELADAQQLAKDPGRLLVDKKRSKARKLNFEPHKKMIGFQVAIPMDTLSYVDQLYTTLFASV